MRAQASIPTVFIFVIVVLVGALLLWVGLSRSKELQAEKDKVQINDFVNSMNNLIRMYDIKSPGSFQKQVFSVPGEYVCFYDKEKEINQPELGVWTERFSDANVFMAPFDTYVPRHAEQFSLNSSNNPSCTASQNGKISLMFVSLGNRTLVVPESAAEISDCVTLSYSGSPDTKIDMVFVGGYEGFEKDVGEYIEELRAIAPFRENNRLNFYRIDRPFSCKIVEIIECDEYELKKLASECPHDGIVVLAERSKIAEFINPVRSSSIGGIIKVNTADNPRVFSHEFGHFFGNLADEYVDEGYYAGFEADQFPNCDVMPCEKWSHVSSGCIRGCSLQKYFRSSSVSLMRDYITSDSFGVVNEEILKEKLRNYR